jgi:hypothetical protein
MIQPLEVLAYIEDGPHGGETLIITAAPDGSPPPVIELRDAAPPREQFEESSLRHSDRVVVSSYHLASDQPRERGRYAYRLMRT